MPVHVTNVHVTAAHVTAAHVTTVHVTTVMAVHVTAVHVSTVHVTAVYVTSIGYQGDESIRQLVAVIEKAALALPSINQKVPLEWLRVYDELRRCPI